MQGMFTWMVEPDPAARGPLPASVVATVCVLLAGCTASVIGSDGTRYVVGPALVSHAAQDGWSRTLSSALEIRTVGLSVHEFDSGYAVSLGYTVLRSAGLRAGRVGGDDRSPETEADLQDSLTLYRELPVAAAPAGDVNSVETIGASTVSLGGSHAVAVGYGHERVVALRDNIYVAGNPIAALDRVFDRAAETGDSE